MNNTENCCGTNNSIADILKSNPYLTTKRLSRIMLRFM